MGAGQSRQSTWSSYQPRTRRTAGTTRSIERSVMPSFDAYRKSISYRTVLRRLLPVGDRVMSLLVPQLSFQALGRKVAEHRRKIMLRYGISALTEGKERFVLGVPSLPMRKAPPVGVSGLGEVRPIALHDLPEPVICRRKGHPAKSARLEGAEY